MKKRFDPPVQRPPVPSVPVWARPSGADAGEVEAAYMAGAALGALDGLVRAAPPWLGAWRHRLALKAAVASLKVMGRREDEAALRDAWYLRQSGDAPGPAGNVLAAWRLLAARSGLLDDDDIAAIAELFGIGRPETLAGLAATVNELATGALPAPLAAARAASATVEREPDAEVLAWWLADLVLSLRMRWPRAVPLLATQIHAPCLRSGARGARCRPGSTEFLRAASLAAAAGSAEACNLGAAIARQAARLEEIAPKLRSKQAGEVLGRLLEDDAVSGSLTTRTLSRWASRRLFERLIDLGAVRELSGRATFRIYGL